MTNDEILQLVRELIEKTKVVVDNISIVEDSKITWVGVEVKEPHIFLDRGAEALSALNHIVRKMIENKTSPIPGIGENVSIMVDINGFQKKRIEGLRAVAHMMAERARYFKSNIEVDPMSAFDRRIVHEFLSSASDLQTESIGVGPSRRVVIKYIGII